MKLVISILLVALAGCITKPVEPVWNPPVMETPAGVIAPPLPLMQMPPEGQLTAQSDQPSAVSVPALELVLRFRWDAGISNGVYQIEESADQKNWTNALADWSGADPSVRMNGAPMKFYRGRKIE